MTHNQKSELLRTCSACLTTAGRSWRMILTLGLAFATTRDAPPTPEPTSTTTSPSFKDFQSKPWKGQISNGILVKGVNSPSRINSGGTIEATPCMPLPNRERRYSLPGMSYHSKTVQPLALNAMLNGASVGSSEKRLFSSRRYETNAVEETPASSNLLTVWESDALMIIDTGLTDALQMPQIPASHRAWSRDYNTAY